VNLREVVVGEVEGHSRLEIVQFLGERTSQASHALDVSPHSQVLAFNMRSRNEVYVRIARDSPFSDIANERSGAISAESSALMKWLE